MKERDFVQGSMILLVINFLVQTIDFIYDVMLSKFIGAEAMGLFQMAMSILMVFLIVSTVGIPTAVSRLVAEYNSRKDSYGVDKTFKVAFVMTLILSLIFSSIIVIYGEDISIRVFKDEKMVLGLYLLIPAIIVISISSIIRGYYYGLKLVMIPSISQIIEYVTRFVIILGLLYYIYPVKPFYGALIALAGISVGEIFDLIWLTFMLKPWKRKKIIKSNIIPLKVIVRQIIPIAIPLGLSNLLNVILRFLNSLLMPQRLMKIGYSHTEAVATFGRITGMTMPLITLPFMITSAMVINLVPNLSEQMALKNYGDVKRNTLFSIKITLMGAIPLTGLYVFFSEPLGFLLYRDLKVGKFLSIMAYGTLFMALQHTLSGVLNGLKRHVAVTLHRILGMLIQILAIYYLVGNPRFGINGFFLGFLTSGATVVLLDVITIRKMMKLKVDWLDIVIKPLLATLMMIFVIHHGTNLLFGIGVNYSWAFLLSLVMGTLCYLLTLYVSKAIPKNPLRRLIGNN